MHTDQKLISDIKYHFGPQIYANRKLQRHRLAGIVFKNPEELTTLNALVHPRVAADYLAWHEQQIAPFTIKEAALTIEIGEHKSLDALIVVTAAKETRIQRVMQRDRITREQVLSRMDKQLPQEQKDELADYLIDNNGHQPLVPQVWEVYQKIIESISDV